MPRPARPSVDAIAKLKAENARLRDALAQLWVDHDVLVESEKMYRCSAELDRRLVWSTDSAGRVTSMSRMFGKVAGITDDAVLRARWIETVHPDDREAMLDNWSHCLKTGDPFLAEFRALMPNGTVRSAVSRAVPYRLDDGTIHRWFGSTQDNHDERESERARREVEERFRLAVQATNDVIWDYDVPQQMVEWSEGGIQGFGYFEPTGNRPLAWWEERLHPEERVRVMESLAAAMDGVDTRWSAAYRFRRVDGSYADVFDRGFIIREDGQAVRAVGAMTDLTERYRAEAELQRIRAELVHVSRVSAMGTMASTLAHELNQPLTALTNYVRGARCIVERAIPDLATEVSEALEAAEAGALRAGEIVRRLRELVSRGSVSIAAEDLRSLIEEAGVLAFVDEHLLGITHDIVVDAAATRVRADRIQIQQVLINLIRNAVQAMEGASERHVSILARPVPGDMIEIAVADSGGGIAPEHMDSLFSRFATTKAGGMGIGLPISRTIVEAHGGKIWAENGAGGGAVFRFTLPRARQA